MTLSAMAMLKPSAKAKAEMKAALDKGKSKAKTATVPDKKAKAFAKASEKAAKANELWERENLYALCRKLAGGDMVAGILLFHIWYEWRNRKKKLERLGKEWLAHSREAWARAAGLTDDEARKRGFPRLKTNCHDFMTIRAMKLGPVKQLWISIDEIALSEAAQMPWDMFWGAVNHVGPGNEKKPASVYQKGPK